jgi:hypothetical protein
MLKRIRATVAKIKRIWSGYDALAQRAGLKERTRHFPECSPPGQWDKYTSEGALLAVWLDPTKRWEHRPYKKTLVAGTWLWVEDLAERARFEKECAEVQERNAHKKFLQKAFVTRVVTEEEYEEAAELGQDLFIAESAYVPGVWYPCSNEDPLEGERYRLLKFQDLFAAQARLRKISKGGGA